jgi:hypothetical protein
MKQINETPVNTKRTVTYSQNSVLGVVAAIILLLLSFYVGTLYQKSHVAYGFGRGKQAGLRARHAGRKLANLGTVSAVNSSSITISTFLSGTSKTFTINSSTKVVNNGQTASVSDIKSGDRVLVRTGGSGSTTATQIDINPNIGQGMSGMTPAGAALQ